MEPSKNVNSMEDIIKLFNKEHDDKLKQLRDDEQLLKLKTIGMYYNDVNMIIRMETDPTKHRCVTSSLDFNNINDNSFTQIKNSRFIELDRMMKSKSVEFQKHVHVLDTKMHHTERQISKIVNTQSFSAPHEHGVYINEHDIKNNNNINKESGATKMKLDVKSVVDDTRSMYIHILTEIKCDGDDNPEFSFSALFNQLKTILNCNDYNITYKNVDKFGHGIVKIHFKVPIVSMCKIAHIKSEMILDKNKEDYHVCMKVITDSFPFRVSCDASHVTHEFSNSEHVYTICHDPSYHKNACVTVNKCNDLYVCEETGIVHECGSDSCDHMTRTGEYVSICTISGKLFNDHIVDENHQKKYVSQDEYKSKQIKWKKDIQLLLNGAYITYRENKEKLKTQLDTNPSTVLTPTQSKKKTVHKRKRNHSNLKPTSNNNIKEIDKYNESQSLENLFNSSRQYTESQNFTNKKHKPSMLNYAPVKHMRSDGTIDPVLFLENMDSNRPKMSMKESCMVFTVKIIASMFSTDRFDTEQKKNIKVEQLVVKTWQAYEEQCKRESLCTSMIDYTILSSNVRLTNPCYMKFEFTESSRLQLIQRYSEKTLLLWYIMRKYTPMIKRNPPHGYFANFITAAMLLFQRGCQIIIKPIESYLNTCDDQIVVSPSTPKQHKTSNTTSNSTSKELILLDKNRAIQKHQIISDILNEDQVETITIIKPDLLLQDGFMSIDSLHVKLNKNNKNVTRNDNELIILQSIIDTIQKMVQDEDATIQTFKLENYSYEDVPQEVFLDIDGNNRV